MLWDHVVQDRVILPGTAFMELAHAAAHTLLGGEGSGSASVANASLVTPLVLQHTEPSAEPEYGSRASERTSSAASDAFDEHTALESIAHRP